MYNFIAEVDCRIRNLIKEQSLLIGVFLQLACLLLAAGNGVVERKEPRVCVHGCFVDYTVINVRYD